MTVLDAILIFILIADTLTYWLTPTDFKEDRHWMLLPLFGGIAGYIWWNIDWQRTHRGGNETH